MFALQAAPPMEPWTVRLVQGISVWKQETSLSQLALARKVASDARHQLCVGSVEWCVPYIIPPGGLRSAAAVVGLKVESSRGLSGLSCVHDVRQLRASVQRRLAPSPSVLHPQGPCIWPVYS